MKDYFQSIAKELFKNIQKDEFLILNFDAEESSFVRLNKGKIRQPGNVKQISLSLSLSNRDKKNLKSHVRLNGSINRDKATLIRTLNYLRRELPDLPKDPYLMFSTNVHSTEISEKKKNVDDRENLDYVMRNISNLDLVGIYSSGYIYTGLANSLGQFNWHSDNNHYDKYKQHVYERCSINVEIEALLISCFIKKETVPVFFFYHGLVTRVIVSTSNDRI